MRRSSLHRDIPEAKAVGFRPVTVLRSGLTSRAIIIGLIGVVVTCFIVAWAELVTGVIMIGFLQLPPVIVALLFLLIIANKLVGRLKPEWRLTPPEIVTVYCMMLLASMVTSRGLLEDLIPMQVGLNYYANPTNKWEDIFFKHLQPWMVPWDLKGGAPQPISRDFFEGLKPGQPLPIKPWIAPTLAWLSLVGLVYAVFLALSAFLQRLWADNELLSFPLVQLPLEMISEEQSRAFLRNRVMWIGFAIPALVFGLNGLHCIYPAIPEMKVQIPLNQYFGSKPWIDMGYTTVFISFAAIGFFYLLPAELLLSLWLFFVVMRLQEAFGSMIGANPIGSPHCGARIWVGYQTAGAYFTLVAWMLIASWPRLKAMFAAARGKIDAGDRHELMPYRTALIVLVGGFVAIIAWCSGAGMSAWFAVVEFGIYIFVQSIIMARSTAEGGLPMTEGSFTPLDILGMLTRKSNPGPRNLAILAFMDCLFSRDLRGLTLTGFLDGQKLADGVKMRRRSLLPVFILGLVAAMVVGAFFHLYLPYTRGGLTMYSYVYQSNSIQFWNENAPLIESRGDFSFQPAIWFVVGVFVTGVLSYARRSLVWWPLHPLGYALCASWTALVFWFPMFVAWLLKTVIQRYGGVTVYTRARPFFLGLIFGEFTMAVFWTLISAIFHTQAPFFPWP
jgi:hypothetical protein